MKHTWKRDINAATRSHGLSYSRFIHGLQRSGIELDRRALAELAVADPDAFGQVVESAKAGLAA